MTLASKWRRLREMRPVERRVLAMAWLGLPVAWLALRVLPFTLIQQRLDRPKSTHANRAAAPSPRDLGRLIDLAARACPVPANCLTKSVLLCWMLQHYGVPHELTIGVRHGDTGLQAHAWVQCDGLPVNDRGDIAAQFHPLRHPAGGAPFKDLI